MSTNGLPIIRNLQELLRDHLYDGEVVEEYKSKLATSVGDNYGSTALFVKIQLRNTKDGSLRSLNTFCKMLPQQEMMRQVFNVSVTFVKEMQMYLHAVPAMLELQREYKIVERDFITSMTAKCYAGRKGLGDIVDDDAVLILEDLRDREYELADRRIGVDYQHAQLVMRKLAIFHALPIALKVKRPDVFKEKIMEAAKKHRIGLKEDEIKFADIIVANMKKWPQLGSMIDKVQEECSKRISTGLPEGKEPFATIVHNDLWVNNMMFRYSDGKPNEVIFLDFQITTYNSPLRDVLFFLFTSVRTEELSAHFDELIGEYHSNFCSCLEQVGVDTTPFSRDAVWEEILTVAGSEIFHILSMLRIFTADKSSVEGSPAEFVFHEDLGGKVYREKLKYVILEFAKRKWI